MQRYESRLTVNTLILLFGFLGGCGESTSPTPELPYTLAVTGANGPLRLIRSDGSTEAEFSCGPSCKYEVARWSRDGTKLSLEGTSVENGLHYSVLYVGSAQGAAPVRIDSSPSYCIVYQNSCPAILYHQFDADWSADGRLVYTLNDTSVIVSAADGSGKRILFSAAEGVGQPRWGASDATITFIVRGASTNPYSASANLYSVSADDGSGLRSISNLAVDRYGWAPDGLSIAVKGPDNSNDSQSSLFLVDPVTGQATELLRGSIHHGFSWSPQRREIAFTNRQTDSLFVVDTNGILAPIFQGDVGTPQWSPDGRYLIATGSGVAENEVSAISRSTGSRRVIASVGSLDRFSVKNSTLYNGYYVYFY